MRIKHGFVDKTVGERQARLDKARIEMAQANKELRELRAAAGAKAGQGRVGGVPAEAFFNAIRTEGPEVATAAASGYWKDMAREYPEMFGDGRAVEDGNSPNGHVGRHGVVRERYVAGQGWMHWDAAARDWRPGEITGRKGIL